MLVLAHAYAPASVPMPRFLAGITITGKPVQQTLPPYPPGLNPLQGPSPERIDEWRQTCARIKQANAQPAIILQKELLVCGPRAWQKNPAWKRAGSLFLGEQWTLSEPQAIRSLPLRYEYAYGGTHKIFAQDAAAARVKLDNHLPAHAINKEEKNPAIAHTVCPANPLGLGLAEEWYVQASKCTEIAAPQIALLNDPLPSFGQPFPVRGLGAIARAWQQRLPLAGTYDQAWLTERHPYLPFNFQFAYWNCAPIDQQISPHLDGDERIILTNLLPSGSHGLARTMQGNFQRSFVLPGHLSFVLVRFASGAIGELAAKLDTVIIDVLPDPDQPDKKPMVSCAWRATVASQPEVRVVEARMLAGEAAHVLVTQMEDTVPMWPQ